MLKCVWWKCSSEDIWLSTSPFLPGTNYYIKSQSVWLLCMKDTSVMNHFCGLRRPQPCKRESSLQWPWLSNAWPLTPECGVIQTQYRFEHQSFPRLAVGVWHRFMSRVKSVICSFQPSAVCAPLCPVPAERWFSGILSLFCAQYFKLIIGLGRREVTVSRGVSVMRCPATRFLR